MPGGINLQVNIDSDLPADATDALTLVAALKLACDCMQRLGLTKWQAVRRAPLAIYRAWDN